MKPAKLSTMEELTDTSKTCVDKILDDDWNARDSIDMSYKLKGDSSKGENFLKLNGSFKVSSADDDLEFNWSDNIEIRTNVAGKNMKGKLKGGRFMEHYDLGMRDWKVKFKGEDKTIWMNPYFRWGATTSLTNMAFNLGLASYWCKNFDSRAQLNYNPLDKADDNSAWSICSRKRLNKGKFWMEWLGGFNMAKFKEIKMKQLRMGWNEKQWGLVLQANTIQPLMGGCPIKDSLSLGAVWRNSKIGALVARVQHFMDDRPVAFEFGMARNVNDKLRVKGKVDQDWNLNLFGSYSCCSAYTTEASLMTNLRNSEKVSGIMDLPVKLGLKVKINK